MQGRPIETDRDELAQVAAQRVVGLAVEVAAAREKALGHQRHVGPGRAPAADKGVAAGVGKGGGPHSEQLLDAARSLVELALHVREAHLLQRVVPGELEVAAARVAEAVVADLVARPRGLAPAGQALLEVGRRHVEGGARVRRGRGCRGPGRSA